MLACNAAHSNKSPLPVCTSKKKGGGRVCKKPVHLLKSCQEKGVCEEGLLRPEFLGQPVSKKFSRKARAKAKYLDLRAE